MNESNHNVVVPPNGAANNNHNRANESNIEDLGGDQILGRIDSDRRNLANSVVNVPNITDRSVQGLTRLRNNNVSVVHVADPINAGTQLTELRRLLNGQSNKVEKEVLIAAAKGLLFLRRLFPFLFGVLVSIMFTWLFSVFFG